MSSSNNWEDVGLHLVKLFDKVSLQRKEKVIIRSLCKNEIKEDNKDNCNTIIQYLRELNRGNRSDENNEYSNFKQLQSIKE
jgi:hypothetical protein